MRGVRRASRSRLQPESLTRRVGALGSPTTRPPRLSQRNFVTSARTRWCDPPRQPAQQPPRLRGCGPRRRHDIHRPGRLGGAEGQAPPNRRACHGMSMATSTVIDTPSSAMGSTSAAFGLPELDLSRACLGWLRGVLGRPRVGAAILATKARRRHRFARDDRPGAKLTSCRAGAVAHVRRPVPHIPSVAG